MNNQKTNQLKVSIKVIAIACFVAAFATVSQAQIKKGLQGPEAKNYKPWKDTDKATTKLVTYKDADQLKGPEAKNYKPWSDAKKPELKTVKLTPKKERLMGPKAKNYKHWRNKDD